MPRRACRLSDAFRAAVEGLFIVKLCAQSLLKRCLMVIETLEITAQRRCEVTVHVQLSACISD